ncbi:hypothetical protein GA0115255_118684 [Streptomyces sp. Ncost-T6T-2b]|nr:hypothetical protein GA0115255_118684 [Streptomyces sp. Ncost-T6T-2b]
MKSALAANMIRSEWPCPRPVPSVPPEAKAIRDWPSCSLCAQVVSENGSSHAFTRCCTWISKEATPTAPTADIRRPKTIQLVRSVAT